jgi:hypothetical protein
MKRPSPNFEVAVLATAVVLSAVAYLLLVAKITGAF